MNQEQRIAYQCDELKSLLLKKNKDYDNSFSRQYADYGILSGLIRLDDKMNRLKNLIKKENKAEVNESIEDTVRDLMGYCCLILVEMSKEVERSHE
jgi:hypothetical protein